MKKWSVEFNNIGAFSAKTVEISAFLLCFLSCAIQTNERGSKMELASKITLPPMQTMEIEYFATWAAHMPTGGFAFHRLYNHFSMCRQPTSSMRLVAPPTTGTTWQTVDGVAVDGQRPHSVAGKVRSITPQNGSQGCVTSMKRTETQNAQLWRNPPQTWSRMWSHYWKRWGPPSANGVGTLARGRTSFFRVQDMQKALLWEWWVFVGASSLEGGVLIFAKSCRRNTCV